MASLIRFVGLQSIWLPRFGAWILTIKKLIYGASESLLTIC